MHIYVKNKKIYFNNYSAKCAVGKRGISKNKKEGDLKTPKGMFRLEYLLYRKDRIYKIKSSLKKKIIKKKMGWCDDINSKKYNHLVKLPSKYSAENLFRKDHLYDLTVIIGYNRKKLVTGKGSAIFLHLADKSYSPTHGCIAIAKKDMLNLLGMINKTTKIIIS